MLLWSQFEKALTLYDKAAVERWAWDSLYLAIEEDGKETVTSGGILDTSISDIVRNCFSAWVNVADTEDGFGRAGGDTSGEAASLAISQTTYKN